MTAEPKFRFGADTGAAAAAFLTLAVWALGGVRGPKSALVLQRPLPDAALRIVARGERGQLRRSCYRRSALRRS
jgi:hypothetical protein